MIRRPARLVSLVVLSSILVGISGCGGGDSASVSDAPERRFLSLGTAPPGGAFFVVGGALAEVMTEGAADSGWQVTAESTKGTQENIRRLANGELDFALANAAISYFAVRGEGGWDQAYPVRAIMTLAPNVALFLTPQGSGIETIADLAGQRVVVGPAGAGFEYFLRPILGAHGVTYDDFTPIYRPQGSTPDLLADGSADAAFLGGAVPTSSITQATASQDIFFVPFAPEAMEEVTVAYPFFNGITVPGGTYRGLDEDFRTLNVGSMHLITTDGHDEELVYQATKTLYENRQKVVERHAAGRAIKAEVIVRNTGIQFHPGAIRYYREIGIWPGN